MDEAKGVPNSEVFLWLWTNVEREANNNSLLYTRRDIQGPEIKFRFVFFPLQMLRFSGIGGQNEQKFGELLTWPKVRSPPNNISKSVHRDLRNATFEGEKTQT